MKYFDESDDKLERIGKVIGNIIVAFLVLGFEAIFANSVIVR
jgi:hypothetical protein